MNALVLWALDRRRWRSRPAVCGVGILSGLIWGFIAYSLPFALTGTYMSAFPSSSDAPPGGGDPFGRSTDYGHDFFAALAGYSHSVLMMRYLTRKAVAAHSEIEAQPARAIRIVRAVVRGTQVLFSK